MKKITLLVAVLFATLTYGQELIITGVFDGPLGGGTPKGVELYVVSDIADMSIFGLGSANNGNGGGRQEFTFPGDSYKAGQYIYVSTEAPNFLAFFGFATTYTSGSMAINGDDAVELFKNNSVIDTFGDINTDGTGQPWEYLDSWAYRKANTNAGPFVVTDWTYGGVDTYDGTSTNAEANPSMPVGTFGGTLSTQNVNNVVFNMSPNPANNLVNIAVNGAVNVSVYNVMGQEVLTSANKTLNVAGLIAGVYFVQVAQNGAASTKKLVIK